MKNKYCNLFVKTYLLKIMGDVAVGIFAKFWKVEDVKLFSVKYNSIFGVGYYDRKNDILSFMDVISLIPFLKNPEEKNF